MGQARKNKLRDSDVEIEFRSRVEISKTEGGASGAALVQDCITFHLEDCTALAERIRIGDAIFGDFSEPRITVMSELGVIGYAPATFSKSILRKVRGKAGRISGLISNFRPPRSVEVEVCI